MNDRILSLQKQLDTAKARQAVIQDYDFMVTPTCPPSTSVNIRAGKAWRNATAWFVIGYNVEKMSAVVDLTGDEIAKKQRFGVDSTPLDLSFTNANWYKAITLGFNGDWVFYEQHDPDRPDYKFYYLGGESEYQTASEAEARIDAILNGSWDTTSDAYGYGLYGEYQFPLWSFVLRNNGTTGSAGQILPIDRLNRGRSYLYRDLRPGKNWILA